MNIFYLDKDPRLCAQFHNNKHCIKMILESAQLLSTAHRVLDGVKVGNNYVILDFEKNSLMYRQTHLNHPSTIYVRQSKANYLWVHSLLVELCKEYTYRYNKIHKTQSSGLVELLKTPPSSIPNKEFTEPPRCLPDYCKLDSTIESYRNYYRLEKSHLLQYKNRQIPYWIQNARVDNNILTLI